MGDFVKEILKEMIEPRKGARKGITVRLVADRMGVPEKTLYAYVDNRDLPARLVPLVTTASGSKALIEELCDLCNGTFVSKAEGRSIEGALTSAVKEFGEALQEATAAKSLKRLHKEIREARQALCDLEESVRDEIEATRGGRVASLADAG